MENFKITLVGIGKLGTAMMSNWNQHMMKLGVFHPDQTKAESFIKTFKNGYIVDEVELGKQDGLILALPAMEIIPFITGLKLNSEYPAPTIINMATALHTKEIKKKFPFLNISGVKYMGHAKDLLDHGNGLFISESELPKHIEKLFLYLGEVKIDREETLGEVNRLATYYAVKSAIEIEKEFAKRGYSPEYIKRALTSISPEVMRSYSEGKLGHFAIKIAKDILKKNENDTDYE